MSREFDFAEIPDEEETVYIVTLPANTTERYMETVMARFDEMFEHSNFVVVGGDVAFDEALKVQTVTAEEFAEQYAEVQGEQTDG